MAKQIVDGTSVTASQLKEFFRQIEEGIITKESLQPFLEGDSKSVIKNLLVVKPNLTLSERIIAGNYDWKNDSITEKNFPNDLTTIGEWEYRLIYPNKNISSDNAKVLCEADGWQAAKLDHLLAFGEKFPEEQKKYPIIALGSVCGLDGRRHVPELWCDDYERYLGLHCWYYDWSSRYRFISVRKISVS